MAGTVTTEEGDTVDMLALRAFGATARVTEAILAANPGLAERGVALPAGLVVTIPDVPTQSTTATTTRIWGDA